MKEFGKEGVNGQHEGHFGVSNIFTKMQLYHGIQTSLFFSGPNAHHHENEAGPVSRQWDRRPEARSSIAKSGLHIPDVVWTKKRRHLKQRKSPVA